jgi:hypothetical protein
VGINEIILVCGKTVVLYRIYGSVTTEENQFGLHIFKDKNDLIVIKVSTE